MDLATFRAQFPVLERRAYLFAGAIAPAARSVRAALDAWSEDWEARPLLRYDAAVAELEALRAAFADLIGATVDEIAVVDGTSRGAALIARLLEVGPGTVLVDDTTYPSSRYPWLTRGPDVLRYVPTDDADDPTAALVAAIEPGTTRVVCVSHVAPLTGRRHDIGALARAAHDAGAVVIVDAAQSAGALPIDVRALDIDVLVTTAMKWLLGPPGIGFLYVRSELLDRLGIGEIGYLGTAVEGQEWPVDELPPLAAGARRFELGLPSLPGLAAARAGIELIAAVGLEPIAAQVERMATAVLDTLADHGIPVRTPADPRLRAGVIAADHPDAVGLARRLAAAGVDIGGYPWGLVRIDPHAFCVAEDIELLDRALSAQDGR